MPDRFLRLWVDINGGAITVGAGSTGSVAADGQTPIAAVLSCADSRVLPELIFNQGPGDLFVVRVAGGALVNAGLSGSSFSTTRRVPWDICG